MLTAVAYCAERTEVFSYYLCELCQDKYTSATKGLTNTHHFCPDNVKRVYIFLFWCMYRASCTVHCPDLYIYSVILSVLDPRKCEYLKDYSLDFEHAYMTTYLASW